MKTGYRILSVWAGLILTVSGASAIDAGVGVKIGTLGLGGDVTIGLHPRLNLRGNANHLDLSTERDIDDISYDLNLDYESFAALLDWHPFANGFRLTGGVVFDDGNVTLDAESSEPQTIGGRTYTPAEMGTLTGTLDFDDTAVYAGLGFGQPFHAGRWSMIFDLGVVFQSYEVTLTADGALADNPQFQQDLREEEQDIKDDVDDFEIYPVIAFGVAYRF